MAHKFGGPGCFVGVAWKISCPLFICHSVLCSLFSLYVVYITFLLESPSLLVRGEAAVARFLLSSARCRCMRASQLYVHICILHTRVHKFTYVQSARCFTINQPSIAGLHAYKCPHMHVQTLSHISTAQYDVLARIYTRTVHTQVLNHLFICMNAAPFGQASFGGPADCVESATDQHPEQRSRGHDQSLSMRKASACASRVGSRIFVCAVPHTHTHTHTYTQNKLNCSCLTSLFPLRAIHALLFLNLFYKYFNAQSF